MWILFAAGSALFAGVTAILAKCGIRKTDSTVATAIRTLVVLVFAWTMVFVVGSQGEIRNIGPTTLLFLLLSGLATGASWLCYFKALQLGDINKVVPIDKSSTVLTILLAFFLLGEPIGLPQGIGVVADPADPRHHRVQKIAAQMGLEPVQHRQFRRLHHTSTLLSRRLRRVCKEHHTTFSPQCATVLAFSSMICTNLRDFWHFSGKGR